jgi:alpha-methylacyl-CoA racemase
MSSRGPLDGLTVIELAGIGPGPYAATLLADMGARVIRIDRAGPQASEVDPSLDMLRRNRESIAVDIRDPKGAAIVRRLVEHADILLEGFRPGVVERLGLGPDDLWRVNPRLVYGRITGWGQTGPLAHAAGHDIDYIAITGALGAIGRAGGPPVPPLNFVGDFGGGSLFLVMGVLAAVWEASRSGRGQVVDAAIVDGTISFTGLMHSLMASGKWRDERGTNMLDTGLPWYDTYETSDGRWMAVGALEPQFYAEFTERLGIPAEVASGRENPSTWPELRRAFAAAFAQRTQAEWTGVFEGTDACVAPVLSLGEAAAHPHIAARQGFVEVGGLAQPAPAPRFSRTPSVTPAAPALPGENTRRILEEFGVDDVEGLVADGVVGVAEVPGPRAR